MKMRYIKSIIFVIVFSMVASVFAYAEDIGVVISRKQSGNEIYQSLILSGKISSFIPGEEVTIKIVKAGADESSLQLKDYYSVSQGKISNDGSFKIEVEFTPQADSYDIKINSQNEEHKKLSFYVPDTSDILELISKLNSGEYDALDISEQIALNNKNLAFDDTIYKDLVPVAKNQIASSMVAENGTNFDINNIYESFGKYTLFSAVKNASTVTLVEKAVNYYNDKYLELEKLSVEALKKDMTKDELNTLYSLIKGFSANNISELKDKYQEAVIISKIKNSVSNDGLPAILEAYKSEVAIETEMISFNNLNDTDKKVVLRYLTDEKNNISNKENLKNKLNYAITNKETLKQVDPSAPNPPVIIGGGGGGGGTVDVSKDYVPSSTQSEFVVQSYFSDISDVSWADEAIKYLYDNGIISGKEPGKFMPYDNITRAEATKMLVGKVDSAKDVLPFNDANGHWGYDYIAYAYNKGFVSGVGASEFGVDSNITRQDMAVIIYRMIQYSSYAKRIETITKTFTDEETISDYAKNSVIMLAEYGIINGFEDGSFRAKEPITRAQAAVIVYNYLKFIEEQGAV